MFRHRTLSSSEMADFEFADEFLPVYDVSDAVATVADTDPGTAWRALVDVDLLKLGREAPLVGMLGALRMLPEIIGHLLHGERPAKPPESMRLRDLPSIPMYEGGWILLDEREGHEIALGLVGKFWRPVIEWAQVTSADEFRDFCRARVREDGVRPVRARGRCEQDAAVRADADRYHRRARAPLVPPLLDVRRWLGSAHPGGRPA
jgi:hypothetical protein